jgi:hypothetical protein
MHTKIHRKKTFGRYTLIKYWIILKLILQLKQLEGVKWVEVASGKIQLPASLTHY